MGVVTVVSRAIQQVEYHKKEKEFDVLFKDGTFVSYVDVPERVYKEFLEASSKGDYLNYHIREVFAFK
jgi:KTSC domain-containing protein